MQSLDDDRSPAADAVRKEFSAHLGRGSEAAERHGRASASHEEIHRRAVDAARRAALEMRDRYEIGDDAFHRLEEILDRIEIGLGAAD